MMISSGTKTKWHILFEDPQHSHNMHNTTLSRNNTSIKILHYLKHTI